MTVVVDASVAAKWFLEEANDAAAVAILRATVPMAPALLRVETAAAITRRFRMQGLSRSAAEARLADAQALYRSSGIVFIPDASLLSRASAIALDLAYPLQDCLYIACAERVRGDLVTVDPKLIARAQPHFPFVKAL